MISVFGLFFPILLFWWLRAWLRLQIVYKEHFTIFQANIFECFVNYFVCRALGSINSRLGIEYSLGEIRCNFKFIRRFGMTEEEMIYIL